MDQKLLTINYRTTLNYKLLTINFITLAKKFLEFLEWTFVFV